MQSKQKLELGLDRQREKQPSPNAAGPYVHTHAKGGNKCVLAIHFEHESCAFSTHGWSVSSGRALDKGVIGDSGDDFRVVTRFSNGRDSFTGESTESKNRDLAVVSGRNERREDKTIVGNERESTLGDKVCNCKLVLGRYAARRPPSGRTLPADTPEAIRVAPVGRDHWGEECQGTNKSDSAS